MIYLFISLLVISLTLLIYFRTIENKLFSLIFKGTTSLIFLITGLYYFINFTSDNTFGTLIIIGLIFGLIGDLFLVYINDKKCFVLGLSSFFIGHIFYVIAFLLKTEIVYYDFFIIGFILIFALSFFKFYKLEFKQLKVPVYAYTFIISIMQTKALSIVFSFELAIMFPILIGSILFVMSDMILAYTTFKKYTHFLSALNLITYYFGQLLIAYSLFFF